MKKQIICVLAVILIVSINKESTAQKIKLLKKTHLTDYPSASSLEFYKGKLYVIGDDASSIWILDKDHRVLDSIVLFPSKEKRIDKAIKADLESSAIIEVANKDRLVLFSSFSGAKRNKIIFVDLENNNFRQVDSHIDTVGIEESNIEGAANVNGKLVLSNRANTTHKNNSLVFTTLDSNGLGKNYKIINLILPQKKNIIGISGIAYIKEKDMLIFSASTEDTPNAYTDGTIGTSYIGYIKKISKKLDATNVKADKMISISKYLSEKSAQKIESMIVEEIKRGKAIVHLAADNDNGESTLFKLRLNL